MSEHRADPPLTVEQAAKRLGVGVRFIRRLIAEKRITYAKYGTGRGSPVRIRTSDLEAFIAENTVGADQ